MFIKNKKLYLICLLISVVGTAMYWLLCELVSNNIFEILIHIVLICAAVAGVLCGSLGVYVSMVKAVFRKRSGVVIVFLPWLIISWFLKLLLIGFTIILGLAFCFAAPGVYAVIAWFKHRDELVEA